MAIFLVVMAFDAWLKTVEVRSDGPSRIAAVEFETVTFSQAGFAPLRLVGAWKVQVDDPRFGGVSALALDGDALLALTDSGTVIRIPKPGLGDEALVRDLPAGPGIPQFKINRDSEALARDPAGRGWWVTFEYWHQLWLYDHRFRRALTRVDFGKDRWERNRGLEAIAVDSESLLLFPEAGNEWLELGQEGLRSAALANPYGDISDAVRLRDGRLLLLTRKFGLTEITKRLLIADGEGGRLVLRPLARLGLGARDNIEGIAAEPLARGGSRLWLMTDNDFRPRAPTLLVALDLP